MYQTQSQRDECRPPTGYLNICKGQSRDYNEAECSLAIDGRVYGTHGAFLPFTSPPPPADSSLFDKVCDHQSAACKAAGSLRKDGNVTDAGQRRANGITR